MPNGEGRRKRRLKKRLRRQRKKEQRLTPQEQFERLLALKKATRCILGAEDKYKIFVRLTEDFRKLGEKQQEAEEPFENLEECFSLSEECRAEAEKLEQELPAEEQEESQTVMTTARERETGQKKGKGKWIALALVVLVAAAAIGYKSAPTRYILAGWEESLGLDEQAMKSYEFLGDYKDSRERAKETAYDYAVGLGDQSPKAAWRQFHALAESHYKDSAEREKNIELRLIDKAKPGATVMYGASKWIVLEKANGKAVLAKSKGMSRQKYHDAEGRVEWDTCSLRKYLNSEFSDSTFTPEEKEQLIVTRLSNPGSSRYSTKGCGDTEDQVYIFSEEEFGRYRDVLKGRAKNMRLRTPGKEEDTTEFVSYEGELVYYGIPAADEGAAIRPVICVKYE